MKGFVAVKARRRGADSGGLPDDVFGELARLLDVSATDGTIRVVFELPDAQFERVSTFLKKHSVAIIDAGMFNQKMDGVFLEYWVEVVPDDVEAAEFLICIPSQVKLEVKPKGRGDEGPFKAVKSKVNTSAELGVADFLVSRIFCSSVGKAKLAQKAVRGLEFNEVEFPRGCDEEQRVWELVSTEKVDFFTIGGYKDKDAFVVDTYPDNGACLPNSGLLGSIRYRASDLESVNCDIFFTREDFGSGEFGRKEFLVVSKRFKKICDELGWKCQWQPVLAD